MQERFLIMPCCRYNREFIELNHKISIDFAKTAFEYPFGNLSSATEAEA